MLPPDVAVVEVIADAAVVVRVAITGTGGGGLQEVNNKINRNGNSSFFIIENIFDEQC